MSEELDHNKHVGFIVNSYIAEAMRTCSDEFHGDLVPILFFNRWMAEGINRAEVLDKIKKSLFYGRENAFAWTDDAKQVECVDPIKRQILHGVLGIFTEAGELLEATAKPFDPVNIKEELGDVLWYIAIICNALGTDFPTIMERNLAKLRARFPEKFTEHKANNRDLDKERYILEFKGEKDNPISGYNITGEP